MKFFSPVSEEDYWLGEPIYKENQSVGFHRMWYLDELATYTDFKISLQSLEGQYTKRVSWSPFDNEKKLHAYIIHRTLLSKEIVFDFDAQEYEQNVYHFRTIYPLLKKMGYIPYIWFSGGKGLHVHFFLKFSSLVKELDMKDQVLLRNNIPTKLLFEKRLTSFVAKSLAWFYKKFSIDGQISHANHLIRTGGSLNKLGFKTFLGHTLEDVKLIPPICTRENQDYPRFPFHHYCYSNTKIKYSIPTNLVQLTKEFIREKGYGKNARHITLDHFLGPQKKQSTSDRKPCITFLESKEFAGVGDGRKRALFVLASAYKNNPQQLQMLKDWNTTILGGYLREEMIRAAAKSTAGKVGCKYTHELLESIGCQQACKRCT